MASKSGGKSKASRHSGRGKVSLAVLRNIAQSQANELKKPVKKRPVKEQRPQRESKPLISLGDVFEKTTKSKAFPRIRGTPDKWTPQQRLNLLKDVRYHISYGSLPEVPKQWDHEERFVYEGVDYKGPSNKNKLLNHLDTKIAKLESQLKGRKR